MVLSLSKASSARRRTAKQLRRHLVASLQRVQAPCIPHGASRQTHDDRRAVQRGREKTEGPTVGRRVGGWLGRNWQVNGLPRRIVTICYERIFPPVKLPHPCASLTRDLHAPRAGRLLPAGNYFPRESRAAERWRQCSDEPTARKPRLTDRHETFTRKRIFPDKRLCS